jgi:UDP-glucose 4-epimerase
MRSFCALRYRATSFGAFAGPEQHASSVGGLQCTICDSFGVMISLMELTVPQRMKPRRRYDSCRLESDAMSVETPLQLTSAQQEFDDRIKKYWIFRS